MSTSKAASTANPTAPCPPAGSAISEPRTVFRCCTSEAPSEKDFRTHEEEGSHTGGKPCERKAMSLMLNYDDARTRVGYRRRGSVWVCVRSATLDSAHGHLMATNDRHANWWPPVSLLPTNRLQLFELVSAESR